MPAGWPPDPDAPDPESLRLEVLRRADQARVRLAGALDLATVPRLRAELEALTSAGVNRVMVDLSSLQFLDSSGLRFLLELNAEARRDGFSLGLVPGPAPVQQIFEITRTTGWLPFIDG
jgi:anti-sigma B factor antagonist